jgi:adenylylsulfate kinase-like enzyme
MIKTLWFFGLSGAGKSTLADIASKYLWGHGVVNVRLDGDMLRDGLCADLGYDKVGRLENITRAACVTRVLNEQGMVVVASFMTPTQVMQDTVIEIVPDVYMIKCVADMGVLINRDPKGLYKKALNGEIKNMYGLDVAWSAGKSNYSIKTDNTVEESTKELTEWLDKNILSTLDAGIHSMKDTSTSSGKSTTNYNYQSSSW